MQQQQTIELPQTSEGAAAALATRCYQDQDFAAHLLRDAKGAVTEVLRQKKAPMNLAEDIKIIPHENTSNTWHIVIPAEEQEEHHLTDDQLESVAAGEIMGGVAPWLIATLVGVGAAVAFTAIAPAALAVVAGTTEGFQKKPVR